MLNNYGSEFLEYVEDLGNIEQTGLIKLDKDTKTAMATLTPAQARYFVDQYYQLQNYRIRSKNQVRALSKDGEPHEATGWYADNMAFMEKQIQIGLTAYADADFVGRWAMSVCGIAGTLSAGLLAILTSIVRRTSGIFIHLPESCRTTKLNGCRQLWARKSMNGSSAMQRNLTLCFSKRSSANMTSRPKRCANICSVNFRLTTRKPLIHLSAM